MKVLVKQKRKEIHVKKSNAIAEKARIAIAQSEATRRERGRSAKNSLRPVQSARALEESYVAGKEERR
jgi:hypothetical protein